MARSDTLRQKGCLLSQRRRRRLLGKRNPVNNYALGITVQYTVTLSLRILYLDNAGSQQAGSNTDWSEDELVVDDFPEIQSKIFVNEIAGAR